MFQINAQHLDSDCNSALQSKFDSDSSGSSAGDSGEEGKAEGEAQRTNLLARRIVTNWHETIRAQVLASLREDGLQWIKVISKTLLENNLY